MYRSLRYSWCDFGNEGMVDEGESDDVDGLSVISVDGLGRAAGGTDLRAMARTSTVSRRSEANFVMAKSRVCSFSLAALRWRFRKSACRYLNRPYHNRSCEWG